MAAAQRMGRITVRLPVKARDIAPRLTIGAFILNSGFSKLNADVEQERGVHGMATGTYPFLKELRPGQLTRLLGYSELALGGALLLPVVPTPLAGVGLTGFAASLLGLYMRTPGMRQEGSLKPTESGTPLAKDFWLLGIGVGFIQDGIAEQVHRRRCSARCSS